ncbi:hypothetical protein GINT2_001416 [Glugoides intestinalis]
MTATTKPFDNISRNPTLKEVLLTSFSGSLFNTAMVIVASIFIFLAIIWLYYRNYYFKTLGIMKTMGLLVFSGILFGVTFKVLLTTIRVFAGSYGCVNCSNVKLILTLFLTVFILVISLSLLFSEESHKSIGLIPKQATATDKKVGTVDKDALAKAQAVQAVLEEAVRDAQAQNLEKQQPATNQYELVNVEKQIVELVQSKVLYNGSYLPPNYLLVFIKRVWVIKNSDAKKQVGGIIKKLEEIGFERVRFKLKLDKELALKELSKLEIEIVEDGVIVKSDVLHDAIDLCDKNGIKYTVSRMDEVEEEEIC